MTNPTRYIRAFFTALGMTLHGEKPPEPQHPQLVAWSRQMLLLVDDIFAAADSAGLGKSVRQTITLRLDGRNMNLETLLGTLRYHAAQEYPSLLRSVGRFNRGAIHATNVNDRYWLSRLQENAALQNPILQSAFARLDAHLEAIPQEK